MKTKNLFEAIFLKMLKFFILFFKSQNSSINCLSNLLFAKYVEWLEILNYQSQKKIMHKRRNLEVYQMTTELWPLPQSTIIPV